MKDLTIAQAFSRLKKMVPPGRHVSCSMAHDRFSSGDEETVKVCYVARIDHVQTFTTWRAALDEVQQKLNSEMEGER